MFAANHDLLPRVARPYNLAVSSFVAPPNRLTATANAGETKPTGPSGASSTERNATGMGAAVTPIASIIGRFQELKTFHHPYLCEYVDLIKGKHDRALVVAEHYSRSLSDIFHERQTQGISSPWRTRTVLRRVSLQLVEALVYLGDRGMVHRNLAPDNCLLDASNYIKLAHYGLYHMTGNGTEVDFPVGSPQYLAPEVLVLNEIENEEGIHACGEKVDTWSLGLILAEIFTGTQFWNDTALSDVGTLLNAIADIAELRTRMLNEQGSDPFFCRKANPSRIFWKFVAMGDQNSYPDEKTATLTENIRSAINVTVLELLSSDGTEDCGSELEARLLPDFIFDCIDPNVSTRPSPKELLCNPLFANSAPALPPTKLWCKKPYLASEELSIVIPKPSTLDFPLVNGEPRHDGIAEQPHDSSNDDIDSNPIDNLLYRCPPSHLYYFWRLAGGDVEAELTKQAAFTSIPPILRCPRLVRAPTGAENSDEYEIGGIRDSAHMFSPKFTILRLDEVRERLEESFLTEGKSSIKNNSKNGGGTKPIGEVPFQWDADYFNFTDADEVNFLREIGPGHGNVSDHDIEQLRDVVVRDGNIQENLDKEVEPDASTEDQEDEGFVIPRPPFDETPSLIYAGASTSAKLPEHNASASQSAHASSQSELNIASNAQNSTSTVPAFSTPATNLPPAPLLTREKLMVYQFRRVALFRDLLRQYPASHFEVIHHARVDIPPLLRGRIWAAVLGVSGDVDEVYRGMDKETETITDRQIEVDVPRCHQYHQLMSTPVGHEKMRRLLKCWVGANRKLVYWQGLDSLCAPFLTLSFNSEALAFASLQKFIPRFLRNFFLYDNSPVIQEYLAVFRHLLSFHDPELGSHLEKIQFNPELYAIPWFLTLFTHVFPLDKIYHLWDKLLVGPPSLPLFAGISILRQIRDVLLNSEFNECILLFSEGFPEVDIEKCIGSALEMCRVTPPSVIYRVHDPNAEDYQSPMTAGPDKLPFKENSALNARWWEYPIPVHIRKSELAPRISLQDAIKVRTRSLVIDVRSEADFDRGHLQNSINVQPSNLNAILPILRKQKKKYHIVIADRGDGGPEIATLLVHAFLPRVAVLTGGVDVVRLDGADRNEACTVCSCDTLKESVPKSKEVSWRYSTCSLNSR